MSLELCLYYKCKKKQSSTSFQNGKKHRARDGNGNETFLNEKGIRIEPIEVISSFPKNESKYIWNNRTVKYLFTGGTLFDRRVKILPDSKVQNH